MCYISELAIFCTHIDRLILKRSILKLALANLFFAFLLLSFSGSAQILFSEECFVGGVTSSGINIDGGSLQDGKCSIGWNESNKVYRAYVICYRYGRPFDHTTYINNAAISWSFGNQIGSELPDISESIQYYATHAEDISNTLIISGDTLTLQFPNQLTQGGNTAYSSMYIVILYKSPLLTTRICNRIYIADDRQDMPQNYFFEKPSLEPLSECVFSIFSSRLTSDTTDQMGIELNGMQLGKIWGNDIGVNFGSGNGTQGHYYFENGTVTALDGDTANNRLYHYDGLAIINDYFDDLGLQTLRIENLHPPYFVRANVTPAFLITYTPTCDVVAADMPRSYTYCAGDSAQLGAIAGYDNYAWSTSSDLSDSTIANPICTADSSRWLTVRMWNDDEGGTCAQTIPVHITVGKIPRPANLKLRQSLCPNNTGRVIFEDIPGREPFTFQVGDRAQGNPTFESLAPGTYLISVADALGCRWDSTVVIGLNPPQQAIFTANPTTGFSPLQVVFTNGSLSADGYAWLVDGNPFSSSENVSYTFSDSGTYQVALIAYFMQPSCADTALITIRVDQGLQLFIPNIITPNGDGRNDVLLLQSAGVAELSYAIYNRWGVELHRGKAINPAELLEIWNPEDDLSEGVYNLMVSSPRA